MPNKGYRQTPEHIAKRKPPAAQVEIACQVCGATRTVPRYYASRYKTCGADACRFEMTARRGRQNLGRSRNAETRAKISQSTRGKPHAPEHVAARTAARLKIGWWKDPDQIGQAISIGRAKGKKPDANGPKNPMWRGGVSVLANSTRQTSEYAAWRLTVLERDGWACQICRSTRNVIAHHILSWHDYKRYRTDVNNGVALCRSCHAKAHGFAQHFGNHAANHR